jgi:hypothetical protein
MVTAGLLIMSAVLFAVGAHYLVKQVTRRPVFFNATDFSRTALKVERYYLIFTWTVLEGLFLYSLIVLTIDLMSKPPF